MPTPSLVLISSDHPHFPAGTTIAAGVERGQLAWIGVYRVLSITPDSLRQRVLVQTGPGWLFVVTAASYAALLATPAAQAVPPWEYTDRVRRPHYYGRMWIGRAG